MSPEANVDVWEVVLAQADRRARDSAAVVGDSQAARARELGDQAMGMQVAKAVARTPRRH